MNHHPANNLFHALQKIAAQADSDRLYGIARRALVTPLVDIDSLDPLNHRTVSLDDTGHDERAEFEERDQDYHNDTTQGMK